jgi:DNA-binding MarR family transcriptional regulator
MSAAKRRRTRGARDFETLARANLFQVLFKVSRLVNEEAIRRVRAATGEDRFRYAHTMLFPHVTFDGVRLTDLAAHLGITKQAVQQLVDELVDMGALERVPDPTDARAKLIRWSRTGQAGLEQGLGILGGLAEELEQVVGAAALRRTHETLLSVLDHFEANGP